MATPTNPLASAAAAAPMPPLPDLQKASGAAGAGAGIPGADNGMAAILAGVLPVKQAVDQITMACKTIAAALPGSEQKCALLMAAAQEFLPMAAQTALAPLGGGPGAGLQPMQPMAPPPGAPPMGNL
jgi:hypothetical protein